jgi:hypothetical protein
MKMKVLSAIAFALAAVPIFAANVNGFENFVLSRDDGRPSQPAAIADFSSRTRMTIGGEIDDFSSRKPCGLVLRFR